MMNELKNLLQKSINKAGISRQVEAALLIEKAQGIIEKLLPSGVNKMTKVLYLRNQNLTIACLNSALAQEIKLYEREIIAKINKDFGKEVIKNLRFLL